MSERPFLGAPGGIERRRTPRVMPGELAEPVAVVGARLLDISEGGLQVEAPVPLTPHSTLRLRLVVGRFKTELATRVAGCRRRPPGPGRPWGVGVEFTELSGEARNRLAHALRTRRSVRPRTA